MPSYGGFNNLLYLGQSRCRKEEKQRREVRDEKGEEQRRAGDSRGSRGEQDKRKKHRPAAVAANACRAERAHFTCTYCHLGFPKNKIFSRILWFLFYVKTLLPKDSLKRANK